ncbi:hNH endonuclease [Escherichia coli]|uniref:hNH endonuclease n=1 Tax=Escherichia coli TaxID=562 RepID=UPI001687BEEC|nr:hNH endonuclease [Escherichia coli]QNV41419.1 hNH endonuclease [Escherichia coli]
MKQMSLIEMDGFLKGKCIPSDLKVNETNAEYLVRKFGELESKLETALRECRSAGITIDNLEAKCAALAAELSAIEAIHNDAVFITDAHYDQCHPEVQKIIGALAVLQIPAYQDFLAEVRAQCLNAFIQHHSAELDAHIKNGGEQFDEKSVRIRDIIVSARLFREQIRKGAAL